MKENRARGQQNSIASRSRAKRELSSWFPVYLNNRTSLQAFIDAVIRLELTGRIPSSRTRNLLRAASIASRNFNPTTLVPGEGSIAAHRWGDYIQARSFLDQQLAAACDEADARDANRALARGPHSSSAHEDHDQT